MIIEEVVIIGLAAWRVTALLSYERGPFDVFRIFREVLGFDHDDKGEPVAWPRNVFAQTLSCPWCLGLWVTPGVWAVWEYVDPIVVVVIAAATVLVAVEKWNRG